MSYRLIITYRKIGDVGHLLEIDPSFDNNCLG